MLDSKLRTGGECKRMKDHSAHSLPDDPLFTTQEAARVVGLASSTLETWRSRPPRDTVPPPFLRLGRAIRYRRSALTAWLGDREFTNTTAADERTRRKPD